MTLEEIDNKIRETQIKLYGKVPTFPKISIKKKYKFVASLHLRKFLLEELEKLEIQRKNLLEPKVFDLEIDWNSVIFENNYIKIKYGSTYTEKYFFELARSSFEPLKTFIINQKLKPINVRIQANKIISISNLNEILNIFKILTLKTEIYLYIEEKKSKSFSKILSNFKNIENKAIIEFFRIVEHSEYLDYLCQIQSKNYKIIPATELVISNEQIISEDDAFLFTITTKTKMFIIWESVLINKATYIFETNEINYYEDLQFIFDFIVSDNNKKRYNLGVIIKDIENKFNLVYKLIHSTKEEWINKIESI